VVAEKAAGTPQETVQNATHSTNIRAAAMTILLIMDDVIHVGLTCLSFTRGDINASPDHDVIRAFYLPDLCAWINDSRSIESMAAAQSGRVPPRPFP